MIITKQVIRDFVCPFYKENDLAHQIGHADEVCDLALKLNETLEVKEEVKLVMLAAYFHDIFAKDREVHHELSYTFVSETEEEIIAVLSDEERKKVAMACLEHRSSFHDAFYSPLSEIISSADRGIPNLKDNMERSKLFWMSRHGTDETAAENHAREHMKEKYGANGYANYPLLYRRFFKTELEVMQQEIDNL